MRWNPVWVLAVAGATALLSGCGSDTDDNTTAPGTGTVRISMTDAPAAVEAVNLVVREVSVHRMGSNDTQGWFTVHADTDTTIDLVPLRNGRFVTLGTQQVPSGTYDQVRIKLGTGSTVTVDGSTHPLTVPSGAQSGLKIQGPFTVPSNGTVDVALDVDASRSIHETGNGTWIMNPVIRMVVLTQSGAIAGQLSPATDATVYALMGSDTISSAFAISDGRFKLAVLPAGTYTVAVDADSAYNDTLLVHVVVARGDTTQLGTIPLSPR
jgi:hypothetical protein